MSTGARTRERPVTWCGTCGMYPAGVAHRCIPDHAHLASALRLIRPDPLAELHRAELREAVGP